MRSTRSASHRGRGTCLAPARPSQDGHAVITVDDDGPGIPPELLNRVFDPFYTTKPEGEGTGLGLSVSAGIVADHHGKIAATQRPGGGARFSVELPLQSRGADGARRRSASRQAAVAGPPAPAAAGSCWWTTSPTSAAASPSSSPGSGWEVDLADSGEEGLRLLARAEYEVVLCDLRMPGMSGHEFYRRLQGDGLPGDRAADVHDRRRPVAGGVAIPPGSRPAGPVEAVRAEGPDGGAGAGGTGRRTGPSSGFRVESRALAELERANSDAILGAMTPCPDPGARRPAGHRQHRQRRPHRQELRPQPGPAGRARRSSTPGGSRGSPTTPATSSSGSRSMTPSRRRSPTASGRVALTARERTAKRTVYRPGAGGGRAGGAGGGRGRWPSWRAGRTRASRTRSSTAAPRW